MIDRIDFGQLEPDSRPDPRMLAMLDRPSIRQCKLIVLEEIQQMPV